VIENYGLSPASVADPTPTHEEYGYADIPAITALRSDPTTQHVHQAIEWAEQQRFYNIAGALRQRALPQ
jgi:hypothetical protein